MLRRCPEYAASVRPMPNSVNAGDRDHLSGQVGSCRRKQAPPGPRTASMPPPKLSRMPRRDGEAEAGGAGPRSPEERLEDPLAQRLGNAGTVVGDLDHGSGRARERKLDDGDLHVRHVAVEHGVGDEVDVDLGELARVDPDPGPSGAPRSGQGDATAGEGRERDLDGGVEDPLGIDRLGRGRPVALIREAQLVDLVDEAGEAQALGLDDAGEAGALGRGEVGRVAQDLGEGAHRGHRRAELVADVAQELVLLGVERQQPLVGGAELGGALLGLDALDPRAPRWCA